MGREVFCTAVLDLGVHNCPTFQLGRLGQIILTPLSLGFLHSKTPITITTS